MQSKPIKEEIKGSAVEGMVLNPDDTF